MGEPGNKVVIVAGAGQEVGKELAIRLCEENTMIGLLGLSGRGPDAVVREVNPSTGRFLTYVAGVSDNRQVTSVIDDVDRRPGRIDILINNAGVLHKDMIKSSTDTHMKLMIDVDLMGPMYCTHANVSYIKGNGGNIIDVSSILATSPNMGSGIYGAAKTGTIVPTKVWVAELAPYKIRVNCYVPGVSNIPMAEDVIENRVENKLYQIPPRKFEEIDDVFDLVSFFCSDQASYVTGQTTGLDGGIWATQTPTVAWKL